MPVSRTANSTLSAPRRRYPQNDLALSVNLKALESRFLRICPAAERSVSIMLRRAGLDYRLKSEPFLPRDRLEH